MFSKEYLIVFISKQRVDTASVRIDHGTPVRFGEVISYEGSALSDAFRKIALSTEKNIRVVLSEELVYMTGLFFPSESVVTRESVLRKAEESVPEYLRKTDWDFQTLRYAGRRQKGAEIAVQVAIVEKSFSERFRQALVESPMRIESVVPKSCLLAGLEKESAEVSVIADEDHGIATLCGVENGLVIAVHTESASVTPEGLMGFIHFLSTHKGKEVRRIVLSHCTELDMGSIRHLSPEGYEADVKDLDVFIGAASQKKISGKDEDVLNIDMFSSSEQRPWWKVWD